MRKNKVPVLLVTGFLGSGKTTFLNWLIQTHPDLKISLILNEFGDIKLESQFIKEHSGGEVAELSNGCMCCIAKSDIPRVVNLILDKSPETEYIVIEASGLSDPDPIRDAIHGPSLSDKIYLENTVCIVDAINFEKTRDEHGIVMSQVGDADIVILSKVKEAGKETTNRVKEFIESIGINTRVIMWDENLSPEMFLGVQPSAKTVGDEEQDEHEHDHVHEKYDEFWFESENEIDIKKFAKVMENLDPSIVRSKGFIKSDGNKYMVQYLPGKFELIESDWNRETPGTAVLFLGKELNTQTLQNSLSACEMV